MESLFRRKHGLENKKIILGVSLVWNNKKGLDIFCELSNRLSEEHQIILVGTNDRLDEQLPPNIISIHKTNNQKELAEIYTAADMFVNPTREVTYTTVNMEAIACGTSVITFKTGGSPERVNNLCGKIIECDDINELEKEIVSI